MNIVVLQGVVSRPAETGLADWTTLAMLEVATDTPTGRLVVPVAWSGRSVPEEGRSVVVTGQVRRRFFRGRRLQRRTEVVADSSPPGAVHVLGGGWRTPAGVWGANVLVRPTNEEGSRRVSAAAAAEPHPEVAANRWWQPAPVALEDSGGYAGGTSGLGAYTVPAPGPEGATVDLHDLLGDDADGLLTTRRRASPRRTCTSRPGLPRPLHGADGPTPGAAQPPGDLRPRPAGRAPATSRSCPSTRASSTRRGLVRAQPDLLRPGEHREAGDRGRLQRRWPRRSACWARWRASTRTRSRSS